MKRIIFTILFLLSALQTVTCFAEDRQVITVHNTDKHGVYVTVGGKLLIFEDEGFPFIDENYRTQVPIRTISEELGKCVYWFDDTKTVMISEPNNSDNGVFFTIGSEQMKKNNDIIIMDTAACVIDGHSYIPLRFLGEALDCDVEYSETDRFADIIITRKSDFQGFNQTDSVTVWGNIENRFHESGGLGSMMPYEGEEPDLSGNMIREYEVVFNSIENDASPWKIISVFWDKLYDRAYVKENDILYTVRTDFPRFLDSLLESGGISYYTIGNKEKALFSEYGWTLDYKLNTLYETIPQMSELGEFSPNKYYFSFNNELSKDIGLDMSKYSGEEVTIDIYYIRESMPEKFYPIKGARGIVVKRDNEIIGAYICAGRHQIEIACSLKGRDFEEITGENFASFIAARLSAEENIVKDNPQEIIERYFKALRDKDERAAMNCISKNTMFGGLTANILNTELYNKTIALPLTNKTFMTGGNSTDNIKSIKNLEIKPFDSEENTETSKCYTVTFDIEYENEETISSGYQYWQCKLIYESDKTGWKIAGFGH